MSTLDIGVLSTYTEGISNSVMEYMGLGKPVVVTDGGASNEIVVDGKTGLLTAREDPDDLAEKIEYLLDHPDVARAMGEEGRRRLKAVFSFDKLVTESIAVYSRSLAKKRSDQLDARCRVRKSV